MTRDTRHPLFTDEHEELRRSIRAFVEKELRPHADEWENAKDFPDSVFARMGELGFLGLHFDESDGGSGGDYLTMLVLAEEMARLTFGSSSDRIFVQSRFSTDLISSRVCRVTRSRSVSTNQLIRINTTASSTSPTPAFRGPVSCRALPVMNRKTPATAIAVGNHHGVAKR